MGSARWSLVVVLAAVALLAATAAVSALVPFASPSVLMLLVPPAIGLALALAVASARRRPHRDVRTDTPDPVAPVALAERIGARARATVVVADPGKAAWRRALR
jgi:hypothetical protein